MDKRLGFNPLPDFAQLHDLGASLLSENKLVVREFRLELDGKTLQNGNTKQELSKLKGSQNVLIYLMLTGSQPWSPNVRSIGMPFDGKEKFLICIEGNIGSRKSDLMQKLLEINAHRQQQVKVIREPVDKDGPDGFKEAMEQFYDALAAGEAASLQQKEASSRFEQKMFKHHFHVATGPEVRSMHVISERSIKAKIHVFNEINYDQGRLLPQYRDDMQRQYQENIKGLRQHQPHAVIFFEISVRQAIDRIKHRGRQSEAHITENYLKAIEDKYDLLYPQEAANVIRVKPSDQPMEELIVDIQGQLRSVLSRCPTASPSEIDEFIKFFQDVRPEPRE